MNTINNKLTVQPILNKLLTVEFSRNEKGQQAQQESFYSKAPVIPEETVERWDHEQAVNLYNLEKFVSLVESNSKGAHCYNDISQFDEVPVLSQGWCLGKDTRFSFQGFTPTRDKSIESICKLNKFIKLFSIVDFSPLAPILFDREWRIIDGYHRWWAINNLPELDRKRFYFVQLDF